MGEVRRLALALSAAALVIAGCGDDDADKQNGPAASKKERESIVIKRRVKIEPPGSGSFDTGKVLSGSKIGDSEFCPGGTGKGEDPGAAGGWAHIVTYTCPDGRLKVGFSNEPADKNNVQRGNWGVISGTGGFKGATGAGDFAVKFDSAASKLGTETYTGSITR